MGLTIPFSEIHREDRQPLKYNFDTLEHESNIRSSREIRGPVSYVVN